MPQAAWAKTSAQFRLVWGNSGELQVTRPLIYDDVAAD
jgi:hypothetical protein